MVVPFFNDSDPLKPLKLIPPNAKPAGSDCSRPASAVALVQRQSARSAALSDAPIVPAEATDDASKLREEPTPSPAPSVADARLPDVPMLVAPNDALRSLTQLSSLLWKAPCTPPTSVATASSSISPT